MAYNGLSDVSQFRWGKRSSVKRWMWVSRIGGWDEGGYPDEEGIGGAGEWRQM